ncbi:DUF4231 domain-containing protein [Streptomyces sp. BI20]|uniref:DUF4231 domain-containing protein n=1 Tax=Streptomyces sp. BI20 TaxID=3403460 RepID=UPI003C743FC1
MKDPLPTGSAVTLRAEDLPALFHHSDREAVARQRETGLAGRTRLLLLTLGVAAGALTAVFRPGGVSVFALCAALAYLGVLVSAFRGRRRKARPQWQLQRSAAEFVKSVAWRYAVHGAPFDSSVAEPERLYHARLEAGLEELRKMGWRDPRGEGTVPTGAEITGAMRRLRAADHATRRETYVRDRLIEQRDWYRRRASGARRTAVVWSSAVGVATALALLLALWDAFGAGTDGRLAGLAGTAAVACAAWSEMRRHQPLIEAHTLIEQDLSAMMVVMQTTITEEQWPGAVWETERYVSPQHTDWLARHSA